MQLVFANWRKEFLRLTAFRDSLRKSKRQNGVHRWTKSQKAESITNGLRRFIDCLSVGPCILSTDHRLTVPSVMIKPRLNIYLRYYNTVPIATKTKGRHN